MRMIPRDKSYPHRPCFELKLLLRTGTIHQLNHFVSWWYSNTRRCGWIARRYNEVFWTLFQSASRCENAKERKSTLLTNTTIHCSKSQMKTPFQARPSLIDSRRRFYVGWRKWNECRCKCYLSRLVKCLKGEVLVVCCVFKWKNDFMEAVSPKTEKSRHFYLYNWTLSCLLPFRKRWGFEQGLRFVIECGWVVFTIE